jgi:uncharacterized membrane protein YfcA
MVRSDALEFYVGSAIGSQVGERQNKRFLQRTIRYGFYDGTEA